MIKGKYIEIDAENAVVSGGDRRWANYWIDNNGGVLMTANEGEELNQNETDEAVRAIVVMALLREELTKSEVNKFNRFAKSLGGDLFGLCDFARTELLYNYQLDVVRLGYLLGKNVVGYSPVLSIHEGDPATCLDVVRIEYGEETEEILLKLL